MTLLHANQRAHCGLQLSFKNNPSNSDIVKYLKQLRWNVKASQMCAISSIYLCNMLEVAKTR